MASILLIRLRIIKRKIPLVQKIISLNEFFVEDTTGALSLTSDIAFVTSLAVDNNPNNKIKILKMFQLPRLLRTKLKFLVLYLIAFKA